MPRIYTIAALVFASFTLSAQGHYGGGSFNPNDYFIPPSPGWVFSLYYAYSQMDYYDASGSTSDFIEISKDPPLYVEIGQQVKTNSVIPMLLHFGKGKILNANWGFMVLPMLNSPNASIALDFYSQEGVTSGDDINIKTFGLGDLYLQPIWLTWDRTKWSTTFSYGLWLPTGKYEPNDPENVGLGYWSHNLRLASRYRLKPNIVLTGALTGEFNSAQEGIDFTEAPHLTLDYGGAYSFKMGHELGFFGFGTWQIGDDQGEKAVPDPDNVYGLGLYGSYWFVPGKFGILGRFVTNFGARSRFAGFGYQVGLNYLLFPVPKE